jgi:hypothetical protein
MALQNRVQPDGEIVAVSARGHFMGNRGGRLHDAAQRLGERRWCTRAWICCQLVFKGRRRQVMGAGYTELFFLDEATALAAGHRPCFECRREDAVRFATLWNQIRGLGGRARVADMDGVLHRERLMACGRKSMHAGQLASLPDGVMLWCGGVPLLWFGGRLWVWSADGYRQNVDAGADVVTVLTPPAVVAVLAAGYQPVVHGSAAL